MLFRKQEVSLWQPTFKKNSGWVSQFGELKGLKNLKARKIADLTPYVVARTDRYQKEAGNPFIRVGLAGGLITLLRSIQMNISTPLNLQEFWELLKLREKQKKDVHFGKPKPG